jgi:hypothetical protein
MNSKLIERMLWLTDHAPARMELVLKFNNSTNGTFRWVNTSGRSRIVRFVEKSMGAVVSEVTLEIMDAVYGIAHLCRLEDISEKYVVTYNWKENGLVLHKGFKTKKAREAWLQLHSDWIDYKLP